jgi:hypothetical protein
MKTELILCDQAYLSPYPHLSEMNCQDYMDVAVLMAVAVGRTKSMALLDRLTYALNPESIRMAIADALKVVQYDQISRNPSIAQERD